MLLAVSRSSGCQLHSPLWTVVVQTAGVWGRCTSPALSNGSLFPNKAKNYAGFFHFFGQPWPLEISMFLQILLKLKRLAEFLIEGYYKR